MTKGSFSDKARHKCKNYKKFYWRQKMVATVTKGPFGFHFF